MKKAIEIMRKMCVIGDTSVGKTSLIRRFVVDKFDDKYIVTIGTKTSKKTLTFRGEDANVSLKLIIWDILGQDQFEMVKASAFKGTSGAFVVMDLTRKDTLHSFEKWLSSLYKVMPGVPVVVLANKNDLKGEFGADDVEELLMNHEFPYFLTSAKTGENVDEAFYTLGKMIMKDWKNKGEQIQHAKPEPTKEVIEGQIGEERRLTAIDVEDIIMARYCELLEDSEFAMAIIREQFKKANVDFREPTPQGLKIVVEYIINAASDIVEASRLEKERKAYSNLIRMIH
jgi:small GTP-binding protein